MWYPAIVTVEPASEPVTLAQAKTQCGVTDSGSDAELTLLISAARAYVQSYCGIRLVSQTVAVKCDSFTDMARLPVAPVISVASISYVDAAGDTQTLPTSEYEVRNEGLSPSIVLKFGKSWPAIRSGSRITVTAVAGFATIPADIVVAMMLFIGKQFAMTGTQAGVVREAVEGIGDTSYGSVRDLDAVTAAAMNGMLENYRTWPLA
jgi:uncharacterized phiE125 gp8 family phage protein